MNQCAPVLLFFIQVCLIPCAASDAVKNKSPIGPWLMDLQLGQVESRSLEKVKPEELALAPPEIKEMYEKEQRQYQANQKLKQLGTNIVPALNGLLRTSSDLAEKGQALIAIDALRPPPEMVLTELTDYLNKGEDPELAALVLARQGPKAIPLLASSRTNRNAAVRQEVAGHLGDFHPGEDGTLRIAVNGDERIWRHFRSEASIISSALLELLKDNDPSVRFTAALSLGNVGGNPAVVVPALIQCLKDKDRRVRGDAAAALGKLGKAAQASVPMLTRACNDPDETVRSEAAFALKSIGGTPPQPPPVEVGPGK
jgi:hypothetical protein